MKFLILRFHFFYKWCFRIVVQKINNMKAYRLLDKYLKIVIEFSTLETEEEKRKFVGIALADPDFGHVKNLTHLEDVEQRAYKKLIVDKYIVKTKGHGTRKYLPTFEGILFSANGGYVSAHRAKWWLMICNYVAGVFLFLASIATIIFTILEVKKPAEKTPSGFSSNGEVRIDTIKNSKTKLPERIELQVNINSFPQDK